MSSLTDPENINRATPNIEASAATLHLGSSTFISAPSPRVWDVLTDTSTWPSWNAFVPRVTIREQPNESESSKLSPILQTGTRMTFHVCMKPGTANPPALVDTVLVVTEAVAPDTAAGTPGRIVWVADENAPGAFWPSMLVAERVHEITDVAGGTELRNWEAQVGWLVYAIKWIYGSTLKNNFNLWVQDLKAYVEAEAQTAEE